MAVIALYRRIAQDFVASFAAEGLASSARFESDWALTAAEAHACTTLRGADAL